MCHLMTQNGSFRLSMEKTYTEHNKTTHLPVKRNVLQHEKLKPGLVTFYDSGLE